MCRKHGAKFKSYHNKGFRCFNYFPSGMVECCLNLPYFLCALGGILLHHKYLALMKQQWCWDMLLHNLLEAHVFLLWASLLMYVMLNLTGAVVHFNYAYVTDGVRLYWAPTMGSCKQWVLWLLLFAHVPVKAMKEIRNQLTGVTTHLLPLC